MNKQKDSEEKLAAWRVVYGAIRSKAQPRLDDALAKSLATVGLSFVMLMKIRSEEVARDTREVPVGLTHHLFVHNELTILHHEQPQAMLN